MPVVNLPRDDRWKDLGSGLGQLISGVLQGVQQQKVQEGVGQIIQDPSVSQQDKPGKIYKAFGDLGLDAYLKTQRSAAVSAQIKDTLAQAGLRTVQQQAAEAALPSAGPQAAANVASTTAGTAEKTARTAEIVAGTPYVGPAAAANIARTQALTEGTQTDTATKKEVQPYAAPKAAAEVAAETEVAPLRKAQAKETSVRTAGEEQTQVQKGMLFPSQYDAAVAKAEQAQLSTPGVEAESQLAQLKVQQLQVQLDRLKAAGVGTATSYNAVMDAAGIPANDPVRAIALNAAAGETDPVKANEKFTQTVMPYLTAKRAAEIKVNEPKMLSEAEKKESANQVQFSTSVKRFLDSATKNPEEFGLTTGAPIKAWLERHGLATGDQPLLNAMEAQSQIVANQATSGGGFFAQGRVRLAQDIAPSISRSPLANIIAMDTIADREIGSLKNRLSGQTPNVQTQPLKDALSKWEEIKTVTGSLQSDVSQRYNVQFDDGSTGSAYGTPERPPLGATVDGKKVAKVIDKAAPPQSVVYFNGDFIDPKTMKPIVKAASSYRSASGTTYTGEQIIQVSKELGMPPSVFLEKYGFK